jgi:hypothetical protein
MSQADEPDKNTTWIGFCGMKKISRKFYLENSQ